MKNLVLLSTLILTFVLLSGFNSIDSSKKYKKLIGTWNYEALDAPYQYQKGKFVFTNEDNKLVGYVMINEYKTELEDIVVIKKNVTFKVNVEGEMVTFNMNYKKKSMEGTATYSGGSLGITGIKIS
ncbi:MAG: hypothetical protein ABFR32_07395 [Bacteroidota bacterium]